MPEPIAYMIATFGSSGAAAIVTSTLLLIVVVCWLLASGLPVGKEGRWLWHPEMPGARVWVIRGFWGRVWKDPDFATLSEVLEFYRWQDNLS